MERAFRKPLSKFPKGAMRLSSALLEAAIETGTPVLGICRGLQVINVHFKGSLIPHLDRGEGDSHSNPTVDRQELVHSVSFEPESILFWALWVIDNGEFISPSSSRSDRAGFTRHRPLVGRNSEGIEHSGGRILGVQWHPGNAQRPSARVRLGRSNC